MCQWLNNVKDNNYHDAFVFQMNSSQQWGWPIKVEIDKISFPEDKYRSVIETILNMNGKDSYLLAWPTLALSECMQMVECVGDLSGSQKKEELLQLLRRIKTITIKYDADINHENVLSLQQALSSSNATMTFCIKEDKVLANMQTFAPWVLAKMYHMSTIQLQALVNRLSMPGQASWRWCSTDILKESHFGGSYWHIDKHGFRHVYDFENIEDNRCKKHSCIHRLRQCYGREQPDHVSIDINWNSLAVLGSGPQLAKAIINIKTLMMSLVNAHERRWLSFQPMCTHITITHGPRQNIRIDGSLIHITDDFQSSNELPDLIEKSLCTQSVEDASLATLYNYTNKENLERTVTTHVITDEAFGIDCQLDRDSVQTYIVDTIQKYGSIPFVSVVNI